MSTAHKTGGHKPTQSHTHILKFPPKYTPTHPTILHDLPKATALRLMPTFARKDCSLVKVVIKIAERGVWTGSGYATPSNFLLTQYRTVRYMISDFGRQV